MTDPNQITEHHILDLYQALAIKNHNRPQIEPINKDLHFSRRFIRKSKKVKAQDTSAQNIMDTFN